MDERWVRLGAVLAELAEEAPPAPTGGRLGAALALLSDAGHDLELHFTRRRDDLRQHPGQISLPGGRVERGESPREAALREAAEEIGLDPDTVEVLGELPAFYIPPSRFWLHTVVGRWLRPHRLSADAREVAEIIVVPLAELRDPRRWRATRLVNRGEMWAWQLDGGHLLWGATAVVTSVLLGMLDPDWSGGTRLADLPPDRVVSPWEGAETVAPRSGPARIGGVPEVPVSAVNAPSPPSGSAALPGRLAAEAVRQLLIAGRDRVLVLAGSGRTGSVGLHAAAELLRGGADVTVVRPAGAGPVRAADRTAAATVGSRLVSHAGALPDCDLVVDALVGRGLDGPLRGATHELVLALREVAAPVVSLDVPTGVDPDAGLVGEAVAADVTLALGAPATGLLRAGLAPFVGDLYVVAAGDDASGWSDPIVRVVPEAAAP